MRIRSLLFALVLFSGLACVFVAGVRAQTPARGAAAPAPARGSAQALAGQVHANLNQLMRGVLFINSNVLFAAQTQDPATVKRASEPSASTDPLTSVYGGWPAVEASALALAEAANLLTIPGRMCANGRPVPVRNVDWPKFVQGLRDAGMAAYKAAQSKDQEAIVLVTEDVAAACANCHNRYRDVPAGTARCQ